MPEELTLLPCPNPYCDAQSRPHLWGTGNDCATQCNYGVRCECGVSVAGRSRDEAVALWNSLPRALVWKNSPPKVPGYYWCSDEKGEIRLYQVENFVGGPRLFVCGRSKHIFPNKLPNRQWAGPISEPYEPNEDGNK